MALGPGELSCCFLSVIGDSQNQLQVLALLLVSWLMPYLLLPDSRYSVNSGIVLLSLSSILIAAVSVQFLVALLSEVQQNEQHSKSLGQESLEVEWSAYIEDLLDKAIAMSDGTDGNKWRFEGREHSTEIYSQDMGTRFPAFFGKVEASGDLLRQRSPVSTACTAEEVFCLSMSFSGRQLSDAYRASDTTISRLGPSSWLSYQTWRGNHVQSPQASLFLQAAQRTSSPDGPRFTCVTVPAPATLASVYALQVQEIKRDKTFKDAPHKFSMVDVKSLPGGGLQVSNILHVDPSVPRFIPSSIVQGFIKTGVCRGATYLEMALKLTLPQPLNMEGPNSNESLEQVTIAGQTCKVSRLLARILVAEH